MRLARGETEVALEVSGHNNRQKTQAVRRTTVRRVDNGSRRGNAAIPRGIEILIKKASVDGKFRATLLTARARAADEIGLQLCPAEAAMLDVAPEAQPRAVIDGTTVPDEQRRAFLGKAAALMLAALSVAISGCSDDDDDNDDTKLGGIRPDRPDTSG